jgi:hypothetical protein
VLVYRLQVVPSSLRDLSVQAIVRFPVYALADHGFREFIFWKHLFSVRLLTRPSTMIMETMIHAEIQSEDEITVNDRAIADHVRGCRMPLDVHTYSSAEK